MPAGIRCGMDTDKRFDRVFAIIIPPETENRLHLSYCSSEKTFIAVQFFAPIEESQFDHAADPGDFATLSFDQSRNRPRRAAGGQKIVDDQDPCAVPGKTASRCISRLSVPYSKS